MAHIAPEPALAAGDDPREFAEVLHAVYDAAMSGGRLPARPRRVISESWQRVRDARVDPDLKSLEPDVDAGDLRELRAESGLTELLPELMGGLDSLISDGANVLVVADPTGRVLWRRGSTRVLRHADHLGFAEGASWSESAVGTNAIGTALASRRAVQVFSAEHFVRTHHGWTCAGSPISDPRTGALLGVVDVSGPAASVHPTTLALVNTVAKLAEARLRDRHRGHLDALRALAAPILARTSGPAVAVDSHGWVAAIDGIDARSRLHLPADVSTGRGHVDGIGECQLDPLPGGWLIRPAESASDSQVIIELPGPDTDQVVRISGAHGAWVHRPSPRHAQILRLLAAHRDGLTAAQLATELFGDATHTTSVRAEISRLRKHFGALLAAEPYRFGPTVIIRFADR